MAKKQIGITLDEETLRLLEEQAKELGLTKSQFIAYIVNKNKKEREV